MRGATARRARPITPGPPSSYVVVGWCGAGWRPRGAARGARRPWRRRCGRAVGPVRAPAGGSSTAAAATRRDHVRPAITPGQRPRPDFWHPTASRARTASRRLLTPSFSAEAGGAATATAWARRCCRGVHQGTVVPNVIAGAGVFKPPLGSCGTRYAAKARPPGERWPDRRRTRKNGD